MQNNLESNERKGIGQHISLTLASLLLAGLAGCCAHVSKNPASQPASDVSMNQPVEVLPLSPGPTLMTRVANGYQLQNDLFRVVISQDTGDVTWWGWAARDRNMTSGRGLAALATSLPPATLEGAIEPRDEQTWQFFGEDSNHIIWRKIYCLDHDRLLVSIIIGNHRDQPIEASVRIVGELPALRILEHTPEQFTGQGGFGTVTLHGYNEFHPPTQPALPTLIESDVFHIKPGDRQGFTSVWKLSE